jgi:hypothetical protein
MSLGTGVGKQVRYKLETTWATPPGASGAQILRRVTSDLALKKATFESGELLSTYQRQDFRHGTKSVEGTINGELSPGTYKDLLGAVLRRAPTTVTAISSLSITIAGTGPTYNVTRSTGDFLTGGIKAGMVVRLTAGTFNAANLNKNLVVCSLTATVLTVMPLNGVALVAEGPIASATLTVPGKVNFVPTTGHLNQSFAFEHYHSDISPVQSERFDGCKINQTDLAFPPQGMSTVGPHDGGCHRAVLHFADSRNNLRPSGRRQRHHPGKRRSVRHRDRLQLLHQGEHDRRARVRLRLVRRHHAGERTGGWAVDGVLPGCGDARPVRG